MIFSDISKIALGLFLVWNSIKDIKKREISLPSVLLFAVVGFLFFAIDKKRDLYSMAGGMAIGICLLLLSLVLREAIGFGDGLVVFVCGVFIGFFKNLMLLMMGFLLTSITGILLIGRKKASKKSHLPFIPFLTLAYGLLVLGGFI